MKPRFVSHVAKRSVESDGCTNSRGQGVGSDAGLAVRAAPSLLPIEGQVRTGRLVVESPISVGLRIAPGDRLQGMSQAIRERLQKQTQEERRRFAAGFVIAASELHDLELPAGNWRITVAAPSVFLYHEEQIFLRFGRTVRIGEQLPSRLVRVSITAEPPGARVRVGRLPAIATPFDGLAVVGDHRFEFFWGSASEIVEASIDRDGQQIVGRRQERN